MTRSFVLILAAPIAGLLLMPVRARAATQSDILQVFVNGVFQCSLAAAEPDASGLMLLTGAACGGGAGSLFGDSASTGPTLLTEPGGSISDVFGVVKDSSGNFDLAFASDTETADASGFESDFLGSSPIRIAEGSGGPFDATAYLQPGLRANLWTATFTSDADVPEPAGAGIVPALLALGLICWNRRRKTSSS